MINIHRITSQAITQTQTVLRFQVSCTQKTAHGHILCPLLTIGCWRISCAGPNVMQFTKGRGALGAYIWSPHYIFSPLLSNKTLVHVLHYSIKLIRDQPEYVSVHSSLLSLAADPLLRLMACTTEIHCYSYNTCHDNSTYLPLLGPNQDYCRISQL